MAVASKRERYEIERQKRLTLYRMGMTDAQMAAALQLSIATIQAWRWREKLPSNRAPKRSGAAQPAPANHPWRDKHHARAASRQGRQKPDPPIEPAAPAAPTADPVTQAAATCDAMVAAGPAGRSAPTDFPVMFCVEIATGRILVDRRPWWLRRNAL